MMVQLFGWMVAFLGALLVLCSHDLKRRGSVVVWKAVLRFCLFGVMFCYGVWGDKGPQIVMTGAMDLTIGLIYLVGLPRSLQVSLVDLLLDRG